MLRSFKCRSFVFVVVLVFFFSMIPGVQYASCATTGFSAAYKVNVDMSERISKTVATSDDAYIQVGTLETSNGSCNIAFIIKLDSKGKILWYKTFLAAPEGVQNVDSAGFDAVCELDDKSYVAVGRAGTKLFAVRVSDSGKVIWQKTYEKAETDLHVKDVTDKDNGIQILSSLWGADRPIQYSLFNIEENGAIINESIVGNVIFYGRGNETIKHTSDGGYLVSMLRDRTNIGNYQVLFKYDAGFDMEWSTYVDEKIIWPVVGEVSGGYVLAGKSAKVSDRLLVYMFNEKGELQFKKTLDGVITKGRTAVSHIPVSICDNPDGGFYLGVSSSYSSVDGGILGFSADGKVTTSYSLGGVYPFTVLNDEGMLFVSGSGINMKLAMTSDGGVKIGSITDSTVSTGTLKGFADLDTLDDFKVVNSGYFTKFKNAADVNFVSSKVKAFIQDTPTTAAKPLYTASAVVNVGKGNTYQLKVFSDSTGVKKEVTKECVYKPANKSIISVSKTGLIKGLKKGTSKLTITRQGKTISITVIVK